MGNWTNPDVCIELCGDGLNMGMYECDDGNNDPEDGCDPDCRIEYGWYCTGGSPKSRDVCFETCGDGLNFYRGTNGQAAINIPGISEDFCDDGNIFNLDGCNEFCYIEEGWLCEGGTPLTADEC